MINQLKKRFFVATIFALLLVTLTMTFSQVFISAKIWDLEGLLEKIKNSPNYDLKVREFKNSPVKILEAKVKEISKEDFEKLTGETLEKETIISAPKTKIQNISNKTIKEMWLTIGEYSKRKTIGIRISNLSIAPGETYSVLRERFVRTKPIIEKDEEGNTKEFTQPFVQESRFWFSHFEKTQLWIFVQSVTFEDGTEWSSYNSN